MNVYCWPFLSFQPRSVFFAAGEMSLWFFFFLLLWYVLARSNNFSLTCMRLCFNISEGNRNIHKIYLTAVTWLEINIWYSHNLLLFKASKDNACCCETLCINLLFFDRVFQMQLFRCMFFYVDIFNFFCVEGCYRLTEGVLTDSY